MVPAAMRRGQGLGLEHVVKGVVEGPQVGVDLVSQTPRQEAEVLPRFDGGPGEDDAGDLLARQGVHGLGHGQIVLPVPPGRCRR